MRNRAGIDQDDPLAKLAPQHYTIAMPDSVEGLLAEIRDIQREHLTEFRRANEDRLAIQAKVLKLQRRLLLLGVGGIALVVIGVLIVLIGALHRAP